MGGERGIERDGALLGQCCSGSIMDGGWSHQADAAVAVFMVVPVEEPLAVSAGVFDRAEAIGEVGPVFQSFELRLGVRIVVRDVRAAVGLGDIEVDPVSQQQQQILPAIDLNLSPKWEVNFGLGVGVTRSTDHLLAKLILGYRFNF